jgi:ParB/RepB/Spo0J family partition protein
VSTELQMLPLAKLKLSATSAQSERRAHFDPAGIAELAESIKAVGMLAPIVARPWHTAAGLNHLVTDPDYEVVAGERRLLAAKKAGLTSVPVSVRELTDEQVLEVQLVENLQREDLHELAEAEGYEALQKLGHSVEEMAGKVGKSKATLYARMKLLALCKDARKAFYDGTLTASVALLVARIPDHSSQREALEQLRYDSDDGESISYREAVEYIHREFTFRLDQAGFPTTDATLLPAAGACSACPKRTGNQPELFADIKRGDVCTDPVCFRQKREAIGARKLAEAKASGQRIIEGKQAASITKYGTHSLQDGFVKLDATCYDDPKNRTYRQLLGKQATPTLLVDPKYGVIEVAEKKDLAPALKGIRERSLNPDAAREKRAKLERSFRQQLYTTIRPKLPEKLGRTELEHVALVFFKRLENEVQKQVLKLWNWELATTKRDGYTHTSADVTGEQRVPKLNDAALARFMLDCSYAQELRVFTWSDGKPELLLAAAKRLKIDPEKIRKDLAAAASAKAKKPAPAKASKKKAARKPK